MDELFQAYVYADVAVVAEIRRLGVFRERFRRRRGRRVRRREAPQMREVVAPYEAVVEELKREVKAKDLEPWWFSR